MGDVMYVEDVMGEGVGWIGEDRFYGGEDGGRGEV